MPERAPAKAPALVIVPGSQIKPIDRGGVPECVAWIRRRHSEGAVIAAVCGGVFVLAESGLLAGRRTTTHWLFADELGRRYPELKIDADRLVIDDNDIVTAGGVLAWTDLGLSLVGRFLGPRSWRRRRVSCSRIRPVASSGFITASSRRWITATNRFSPSSTGCRRTCRRPCRWPISLNGPRSASARFYAGS